MADWYDQSLREPSYKRSIVIAFDNAQITTMKGIYEKIEDSISPRRKL